MYFFVQLRRSSHVLQILKTMSVIEKNSWDAVNLYKYADLQMMKVDWSAEFMNGRQVARDIAAVWSMASFDGSVSWVNNRCGNIEQQTVPFFIQFRSFTWEMGHESATSRTSGYCKVTLGLWAGESLWRSLLLATCTIRNAQSKHNAPRAALLSGLHPLSSSDTRLVPPSSLVTTEN